MRDSCSGSPSRSAKAAATRSTVNLSWAITTAPPAWASAWALAVWWSSVADPLLDRVAAAVSETADMAMGLWHADESRVRKWEKYPGHPVCDVDIEADRLLRERLTVIHPGAAWLSEETADDLVRLRHERI